MCSEAVAVITGVQVRYFISVPGMKHSRFSTSRDQESYAKMLLNGQRLLDGPTVTFGQRKNPLEKIG